MKKQWLLKMLVAILILTSVQPVLADEKVNSLKVGITKDENSLNPYTYVTGYPGLDMINLLYDNLFQLDEDNIPQPWLVDEYEISDDGLVYNFTIHDNVKWHDGQNLTTEDIKFTMEYFMEYPKSRFTNPLKIIETIEIHDETSFTLVLSKANPNFMIQPLADLPILPKHIWSEIANPDEESNSIGSGPYVLEQYQSNQFYKMTANPNYYKGDPAFNEIIFPIIEDTTALFTALQAGEIDVISSSISPELVSQFESNPKLKVVRGPGYTTTLFQINAERYPMTEKPFRQAIGYAIDTQYLVDTILLGYAEVGSPGFIHPSSPYYNNQLSSEPNLEKAKQTLEDAGFIDTNGDGFREDPNGEKIELINLVYANNPIRIRTAEIITEWLNEIGINVKVRAMDATTVDALMWPDFDVNKGRDFDLGMWGWSATMQLFPDRMIELFHSDPSIGSVNIGGYSNPDFDALAESLRAAIDPEERMQIIKDMQVLITEDAPIVPLNYQEIVNAYNPDVYDNYKFQLGKGVVHKMSFVTSETDTETPTTSEEEAVENTDTSDKKDTDTKSSESEGKSNNSLLILLAFIAALVVGGILLKKKTNASKKQ